MNGINLNDLNFPNQARIYGTLPRISPDPAGNDYMQLLGTNLTTIGSAWSERNGQLDGAMINMAQSGRPTVGDSRGIQARLWLCPERRRPAEAD